LELAKTTGSATAANLPIDNDGTIVISAGSQTAGAITGTGITQVNTGATLTATSIVQDMLIIGGAGASAASMPDGSTTIQVPEPGMWALLLAGICCPLLFVWRRK
jgi:hypothetical protein